MNLRHRYAIITIRTLFGLLLIALGIMGLFVPPPTEGLSEAQLAAIQGLDALGIATFIALVELVAGLLIVTNYLPAFGALLVAPIFVGIIVYHLVKDPATILPGVIVAALNIYLAYAYWDKYKALFVR